MEHIEIKKKKPLNESQTAMIGDTIIIRELKDFNPRLDSDYINRSGVVEYIDDAGFMHGTWGGIGVHVDEDKYDVIRINR